MFRRNPRLSLAVVLILGVAIGASTATFSVMNGVLLRELPVEDEDRVVVLRKPIQGGPLDHGPVFSSELAAFQEWARTLETVAGHSFFGAREHTVFDDGQPFSAYGTEVTGEFFAAMGVEPLHGRTLSRSDSQAGAPRAIVIGHGLWQRHYGSDPLVSGRVLERDGQDFAIVGVLPPGFEFPSGTEFWVPVPEGVNFPYEIVARLRPGATIVDAREDYGAFLRDRYPDLPAAFSELRPTAVSLHEAVVGEVRMTLWVSAAAVGLLLLIACANVANLLLIRNSLRAQEFAVRASLGAGRRNIVLHVLAESAPPVFLGGILGAVGAVWALQLLVALAPPALPKRDMIQIDAFVLTIALATTAAAALLSGLLPAVLAAGRNVGLQLSRQSRTASAHRGMRAARHGLIVGQIALALLVAIGAGLLVRSLLALEDVDLGFDSSQLFVLETHFRPGVDLPPPEQVAMWEELLARVTEIPGVISAASLSSEPFPEVGSSVIYTGEGQSREVQATNPVLSLEVVGEAYFRTMDVPISAGRPFNRGDREDSPPVVIVSDAVTRHTWPGEDPIGRRIKLGGPNAADEWLTVAGVVGETRYRELATAHPALYMPTRQFGGMPSHLAVRGEPDPELLVSEVQRALSETNPDWLLVGGGPMSELMGAPLALPRFRTLLLGLCATITLLLAGVGVYGVTAADVRQRTREIGIRIALGAEPRNLTAFMLRRGLLLGVGGCAVGTVAALVGTRVLSTLLFGVEALDPATFIAAASFIIVMSALASYLPARQASRWDPVRALASE